MSRPALRLEGVTKRFGGVVAVNDLSLEVNSGEILALIGPNGAGKTTLFNLITGFYTPTAGRIYFDGASIIGWRPHKVTRRGIARTFQNIRLFPNMSALENVMVGADAHHKATLIEVVFGLPRHRSEEQGSRQTALDLLEFVDIAHAVEEAAKHLSYGDQRRLEIARALATSPRLLLLDEPTAGMNPTEKAGLQQLIARIRNASCTVLLIEHDMNVVMQISDRIAVLDFGRKIAEGTPEQVQRDPAVRDAYLGAPLDAS
jgi:branched-chain amino acid transport system ATP-binding protein